MSVLSRATLSAALLFCACALPSPARTERAAAAPRATADPLAEPWILTPSAGEARQRLVVDAVLTSRIDSIQRVDTLRSVVEAATSRVVSGGVWRLGGLITTFSVGDASPTGLTLPQPFSAELDAAASQPRLVRPPEGECSVAAAAAQSLRELWIVPPAQLRMGSTWSDSSRFTVCRDSIPLVVTASREYRVLGADVRGDAVVVRVARASRSRLEGEGLQFGERVVLSGEGNGDAMLTLSLAGGWVLEGEGSSELTLRLVGRHRSQELHQSARLRIGAPVPPAP